MELVTCPACGCRVQVTDSFLGRRVRCIACDHRFLATPDRPAPPFPPPRPSPPRREGRGGGERPAGEDEFGEGERQPYCPGCGRRIGWDVLRCPFCGEEFEPEDDARRRRMAELIRRDYEPHRGPLIVSLGNFSMIVGGLSICLCGAGAIVSVPVGVLVWLMANHDLQAMREGRMDPRGRAQTKTGRAGAVAGIILGLIFAAFFGLLYLAK